MLAPKSMPTNILVESTKESAFQKLAVWIVVIFSFLPYAAFSVGNNTNIPLISVISLFAIPYALRNLRLVAVSLSIILFPFAALFFSMLGGMNITTSNVISCAVWAAHVIPILTWAVCVIWDPSTLLKATKTVLLAASTYACIQKFVFLDHGTIPFLRMYDMPGYWSVIDNSETIIDYIKRPFGWFPEPSFMAGSLALGLAIFILLKSHLGRSLGLTDWVTVGIVIYCLILSNSGSSAITIILIVLMIFWPRKLTRVGRFALLPAGLAAVVIANVLLAGRSATTINYSWNDRFASIASGLAYVLNDPQYWFAGVGQGNATVLANMGKFDYSDFGAFHSTEDIVSVTGRMMVEGGILGTLIVFGICLVLYSGARRTLGILGGISLVGIWMAVSFLTISYESATLIWALPGVCLSLSLTDGRYRFQLTENSRNERHISNVLVEKRL